MQQRIARSHVTGSSLRIALAIGIAACSVGSPGERDHARDSTRPIASRMRAVNVPDDTSVIVGRGVATPVDDTLGTRYGKHWGPARILLPPDCRPNGPALCIADSAS